MDDWTGLHDTREDVLSEPYLGVRRIAPAGDLGRHGRFVIPFDCYEIMSLQRSASSTREPGGSRSPPADDDSSWTVSVPFSRMIREVVLALTHTQKKSR